MKQLGTIDSAFINLEHATVPQHIGGFGIYDPSTAPGGFVRFKDVIANVTQRLQKMPIFRTRLKEVPFGLDKPYWVEDEHFDVEFHLRHISLPDPGDWRQLCITIARLHSRPLDMSRPLWQCYVIGGLDNIPDLPEGAFAIYTKMHHSMIDGAGSESFMTALHDLEPLPVVLEDEEDLDRALDNFSSQRFENLSMLGKAAANGARNGISRTRGTFGLARDLVRTAMKLRNNELSEYASGPKTRFDEPVGQHRVFDAARFDLEDFKAIRKATGTTINDVAVAVVAGGLRKYLNFHDELPEEPLAGSVPVNIRSRRGETEDNNQIAAIMTNIHTDISDPLERLKAISASLDNAKGYIDTPLSDPMKIAGIFSPAISKRMAKWYIDNEMTRRLPVGSACVITNVMGPRVSLYSAGAKLVQYHCTGVLTPGGGLFHSVFSFDGAVSISAIANRDAMPDPDFYMQCIHKSFEELKQAALSGQDKPSRRKKQAGVKAKAKARPGTKVKTRAKIKTRAKAGPQVKAKARPKSRAKPKS
ncbi:wax ester/triacylglycerol synthase family O-acyltransferase [Seongchinamella sediminis]|uniref:diacylglycerol O-acyltransferase n=1 Tax=Seongchinamella sediminis TaxID=2283635 RepID=A0A3L7DS98_9GAMM|nr:wax ester/triacylglycerol synthase family O-acyltransferase [Seongchinamella sediminis]RLQ20304.1 wax ester/triacylglycerol synthase family O-acyltransferase [Seongchinamella sediminis]